MQNFVFHNPTKLIFGENTIEVIGKEISKNGIKRILLLYGGGSIKKNGVYDTVVKSLKDNNIVFVEHSGVVPNPVLSHANEGIELCKRNNLEAILAVGGGSVIDEAKSIAAGFYLNNLWDAFERKEEIKDALPVFTILTISGTGSEMNPFAVLTNEFEKKKWNIGATCLYPRATIIDPRIQMSLPWHQTVNGGIDAISHILEYYFNSTVQEVSISISEALIRTIVLCLDKLQVNQYDYPARANLAWAATLALNGFVGSSTIGEWAAHRIEHGISALYPEIAHGAGLAVVFPAWISYTRKTNPSQYERFAKNVWNSNSLDDALTVMKSKYSSWGAPISLRELNIPKEKIGEIAYNASRLGVVGNLLPLTEEEMAEILELAY